MRKAVLFTVLILLTSSVLGQTPDNVEKAIRHRNVKATPQIEKSTSIQKIDVINLRILENKSSAQLVELGSRYGWAKSNAQLDELGSRYGWAKSNAQLDELGSRYGWAKSNAQLDELGSRYGWAK